MNRKYIDAWYSVPVQTNETKYGISHICIDDLESKEEQEKIRKRISAILYDNALRRELKRLELENENENRK